MGHRPQPCFVDKLAGDTANTVGLVLNTDQGVLEVVDELHLASGQLSLLFQLECGAAIFGIEPDVALGAVVLTPHLRLQELQLLAGRLNTGSDEHTELLKVFVAVPVEHFLVFSSWGGRYYVDLRRFIIVFDRSCVVLFCHFHTVYQGAKIRIIR